MLLNNYKKSAILIIAFSIAFASCSAKKGVLHSNAKIPVSSKIGIIVDSPNNLKNVVLALFMKKGYQVTAINASDLYTFKDVYDIADMKKLSYDIAGDTVPTVEKTYENMYKLHIYNFELNKAQFLRQIRDEWNVEYLIILDYKDWEKVSWARVINLRTFEIDFIENYPTGYTDNIETITNHFIKGISGR
ncbi:MAG TPA: hypothetical protein PK986_04595 [Spirochaetota bacterium]|nr:hypothetical protein [Spirochaetota bacterium]HQO39729.1 hypothetical protein [Spirochaetota bacterium]